MRADLGENPRTLRVSFTDEGGRGRDFRAAWWSWKCSWRLERCPMMLKMLLRWAFLTSLLATCHSFATLQSTQGWGGLGLGLPRAAWGSAVGGRPRGTGVARDPIFPAGKGERAGRYASGIRAQGEGTLSSEAREMLGRLMKRPVFDVERVGGGALKDAFTQKRFLSAEDLSKLRDAPSPSSCPFDDRSALVCLLQNNKGALLAVAKKRVDAFPGIYEEGGGLYPPVRAEQCQRDFETFLQLVCYATAAGTPKFDNEEGTAVLRELYREMEVPLEPMLSGVEGLREASEELAGEEGVPPGAWREAEASYARLLEVLTFTPKK